MIHIQRSETPRPTRSIQRQSPEHKHTGARGVTIKFVFQEGAGASAFGQDKFGQDEGAESQLVTRHTMAVTSLKCHAVLIPSLTPHRRQLQQAAALRLTNTDPWKHLVRIQPSILLRNSILSLQHLTENESRCGQFFPLCSSKMIF
jgi:hypothetical protein